MTLSTKTTAELARRDMERAQRLGQIPQRASIGIPTLGSIGDAFLEDVPKLEDCNPGFMPSEYNILIITATIATKAGAILLSDETKDRLVDASQLGRIIRASPIAFNYDTFPPGTKPQVGDLVWFARFSGGFMTGVDGKTYRIIKDKDVVGVIPSPTEEHDVA